MKKILLLVCTVFCALSTYAADDNTLYIANDPFSLKAPSTENELSIAMKNADATITGLQFDLYLPTGLSVSVDEDGYTVADVNSTRAKKHNIETKIQTSGAMRVMMYHGQNAVIKNSDGEICTLGIDVDASVATGTYDVVLKGIVLSATTGAIYYPADVTTKVTVENATGINGTKVGKTAKVYFNLQGQQVNTPQKGVNIVKYSDGTSKKVVVK